MKADQKRLEDFLGTLAGFSEPVPAGVQRISWTPEYRAGAEFVKKQMAEAGLRVSEDGAGNVLGVLPGTESGLAELWSGSHLDTVRSAGAYDGTAGVACALEAARMIRESGRPLRRSYVVFGTVEEEGTRCGRVVLGSSFLMGTAGAADLDTVRCEEDQKTLREVLRGYGLSGDVSGVSVRNRSIRAFLELHGEQGPVLEETRTAAGIVEHITGMVSFEAVVTGQAGHCGTVPMDRRRDAGAGAFAMLTDLTDFVTKRYAGRAVLTAGKLSLSPGSANCIPGECRFTLDIRSGEAALLDEIAARVSAWEPKLAARGLSLSLEGLGRREPVPMDPALMRVLEESCRARGVSCLRMDSGAGHDSMNFARYFPTAMLFLPNRGGISHNPAEYISGEALRYGSEVLYEALRRLDQ